MTRLGVQMVITVPHNRHLTPSATDTLQMEIQCSNLFFSINLRIMILNDHEMSKLFTSARCVESLSISCGKHSFAKCCGDPLHKTYAVLTLYNTFTSPIRLFISEIVARVHKKGLIIFNSLYVTRSTSSL